MGVVRLLLALTYLKQKLNPVETNSIELTMKKQPKYEEAVAELESIARQMENDELDVDQLTEQLRRARELTKLCRGKLTQTDEEIKKILGEE